MVFPSDELRADAGKFELKVQAQVAENPELGKLVQTLEQGYASGGSGPSKAPIGKPSGKPRSVDELTEELENYLSTMRKNTDELE
jgi:hypothetical protein